VQSTHSTTQVDVALGGRSYPILIGQDALAQLAALPAVQTATMLAVVSNTTVHALHGAALVAVLAPLNKKLVQINLPDGEAHKDWACLDQIFSALLAQHCDRKTVVLAFGGGVVGDMAGFAAACYMRGVPFVQVPTTLLAQVDSSVGGKTAINHPLGKNMIGAFYQPRAVVADVGLLKTLPVRELQAGLAEVIKHALIADTQLLDWLEQHLTALLAFDSAALTHVVKRSCEIKAAVVAADETEQGVRATLNFGHTFGHALEAVLGYGNWLHGEAVGCGMVLAAKLSHALGMLDTAQVQRITALIAAAGLPVHVPHAACTNALLEAMLVDKKNEAGQVRFIVLPRLGQASVQAVPLPRVVDVIDASRLPAV
jgi:3-dehydroquinate synthase